MTTFDQRTQFWQLTTGGHGRHPVRFAAWGRERTMPVEPTTPTQTSGLLAAAQPIEREERHILCLCYECFLFVEKSAGQRSSLIWSLDSLMLACFSPSVSVCVMQETNKQTNKNQYQTEVPPRWYPTNCPHTHTLLSISHFHRALRCHRYATLTTVGEKWRERGMFCVTLWCDVQKSACGSQTHCVF